MKQLYLCGICKKEMIDFPSQARKYCSRECAAIGKSILTKGTRTNEKNPAWKGKKVGYMGLHNWVRRHLGTPSICKGENCSGKSTRFDWANISGKYKRDLKDWIRLCASCHMKMDFNRNDKKHIEMRKQRSIRMIGNKYQKGL